MSQRHRMQDGTGVINATETDLILDFIASAVPTDATAGYAPGCICRLTTAVAGATNYVNEGTATSCDFNPQLTSASTLTSQTLATPTITNPVITDAPGASTAAAGTTTANAGALPAGTSRVYPTTGADDTAGVVINASDKVTGRMIFIGNGVSNKILKVYPASGGTINGAAADAAFSSVSGKGVIAYCLNATSNTWLCW